MGFGKDFLWGAATAAAQIEGGWTDGGRTPSIWDMAPSRRIRNGETCHDGFDHYHRVEEDVALMKEIGLRSYRFSVSWSRILPREGVVNPEGVRFYVNLVKQLRENGMADHDIIAPDGGVHDEKRIGFLREYLAQLERAVDEGIPVLGYQYWSLMDNFEWAEGYAPRFGLIHVDYATKRRTLKDSAYYYQQVIRDNQ